MTITIEVPDDLAARLQTLPQAAADLNAFVVAALAEKADVAQMDAEMDSDDYYVNENGDLDPDLVAALRGGLADRDAGHLHTLEDVRAGVEAALAARRSKLGS